MTLHFSFQLSRLIRCTLTGLMAVHGAIATAITSEFAFTTPGTSARLRRMADN